MEEEYWKRFCQTGKIKDYLYYKGLGICRQVMERNTQGSRPPKGVDYRNPRWS